MLLSTSIFLFFLFLTYALFLLSSRKSDARRIRMEQRIAEALRDTTRTADEAIQISRDDMMSSNEALNRFLSSIDLAKNLERLIAQADSQITVVRLIGSVHGSKWCVCDSARVDCRIITNRTGLDKAS
jgi:hypothetical protein